MPSAPKPVKVHWKTKTGAACKAKTGRQTIICNDVTCAKCAEHTERFWHELMGVFAQPR